MYDCDTTELLNVYIYLVFVGEGCLALVPSHLPHLRRLGLVNCCNMCGKYLKELVAAAPELEVVKELGDIVGAMRNKHLQTTYKCCTSDVEGTNRQCTWPDQSEYCNCNH